jgi:hypothetical protein
MRSSGIIIYVMGISSHIIVTSERCCGDFGWTIENLLFVVVVSIQE